MTASTGTRAIKTLSNQRDAHRARQKRTRELQRQHVLDGELTAEELVAHHQSLRAECMARHPGWFGVAA